MLLWIMCGFVYLSPQTADADSMVVRMAPDDLRKGTAALEAGALVDAVKLLKRATQSETETRFLVPAHANLCVAYFRLGLENDAVLSCSEALQLAPQHWQALVNRGNAYFSLGQLEAAIQDYKKAMARRPRDPMIARQLEMAEAAFGVAPDAKAPD